MVYRATNKASYLSCLVNEGSIFEVQKRNSKPTRKSTKHDLRKHPLILVVFGEYGALFRSYEDLTFRIIETQIDA